HEDDKYFAYERSYGSFSRAFTLPEGIDAEHVKAELKDGELRLVVPKKPEAQPRKITIGVGGAAGEKKVEAEPRRAGGGPARLRRGPLPSKDPYLFARGSPPYERRHPPERRPQHRDHRARRPWQDHAGRRDAAPGRHLPPRRGRGRTRHGFERP